MADLTLTPTLIRPIGEWRLSISGDAYEALSMGDLVILDPTALTWKKANAGSAAGVKGTLGIVLSGASGVHHSDGTISTGERITVLLFGIVQLGATLVAGTTYWASTTAGKITDIAPVQFRSIGAAINATALFFNPAATEPAS